jgi:biopolymer transport protein ExbB
MKSILRACLAAALAAGPLLRAADPVDAAMASATLEYARRLQVADQELTQTRERIEGEKAPLLRAMRAAQDRIIAAEAEDTRLETARAQSEGRRAELARDLDTSRKNEGYLATLAHDGLAALDEGLRPGEAPTPGGDAQSLRTELGDAANPADVSRAMRAADLLLAEIQRSLGGYTAAGSAMLAGGSRIVAGTFAYSGPETFFRPDSGGPAATVRRLDGVPVPVAYPLPAWADAAAAAFFQGRMGTVPADATGGKALRLQEVNGTVLQHIQKGGVMSYAILALGTLALGLILAKIRDLSRIAVSPPAEVEACLRIVAAGSPADREQAVRTLRPTTAELFAAGLRHLGRPREALEEGLSAVLLRQRLHFERWLPLLAVIATAAPLMGLLGTVMGLVRTFALITVFGTGNAGKLASGISEVLVSTELGLMVAIPTLIAHGYLSYRIHQRLSALERSATEFASVALPDEPEVPVGS